MNALNQAESERLKLLEKIIAAGKEQFLAVCEALAEISAKKLWRVTHETFAEYCEQVHGFSHWHIRHMVDHAEVVKSLPAKQRKHITAERQSRELKPVPVAMRPAVVATAVKLAAGDRVHLGHLTQAREVVGGAAAADRARPYDVVRAKSDIDKVIDLVSQHLTVDQLREVRDYLKASSIKVDGVLLRKKAGLQ